VRTRALFNGGRAYYCDPVFAYLDPSAGSMLVQALAGGIAGVAVVGKLYWARLKRVLRIGGDDTTRDDALP
jgi:hypothetical protein